MNLLIKQTEAYDLKQRQMDNIQQAMAKAGFKSNDPHPQISHEEDPEQSKKMRELYRWIAEI